MKEGKKIGGHIIDHLQGENGESTNDPVLLDWLETANENKQDLSKYIKIWNSINILASRKKYNLYNAWENVNHKISRQSVISERFKVSLFSVAATLLILLAFSFYFNWFSKSIEKPLKLTTDLGSHSGAVLPDGTKVNLNAGSELTYHFDKKEKTRSVHFNGEGYFEVEKNKKPFIIHLQNGLTLKVLGTKFNLSAYSNDVVIKTALIEGKVELIDSKKKHLILAPGQIGTYNKKSGELNYLAENVIHNLSWMEKKLYMDNMSLKEICEILERWYDVQITFSEKQIGENIHYTGVLQEKSIYDVFEALNKISMIKYKMKGKNIIVFGENELPMKK